MQPFDLALETRRALVDYLRATFGLQSEGLERRLFAFLEHPEKGLFRGPFVDLRLPFRRAHADTPSPLDLTPDFTPYAHQVAAWERLSSRDGAPRSTLVTTGTGSGKTECFLYPILDHCLRENARKRSGIKAIVVYPMNALATDQVERTQRLIATDARLKGVSVGLYVGAESQERRRALRQNPPDVLLTNYRMLDLLLLNPKDAGLFASSHPRTLRYLVLDEVHVYDGAQATDVACLVRRLEARVGLEPGSLCGVGTSATVGGPNGADALARFASQLFGHAVGPDAIVGEDRLTLEEAFPPPLPDEAIELRLDPTLPVLALEDAVRDPIEEARLRAAVLSEHLLGIASDDPLEIGDALARHSFLRRLLEVASRRGRGPKHVDELVEALAAKEPAFATLDPKLRAELLGAFVALICYARRRDGTRVVPFLDVQVQLWMKELRGLVAHLPTEAAFAAAEQKEKGAVPVGLDPLAGFAFRDEVDVREPWAPIASCRECGSHGLGAVQPEAREHLVVASRRVGDAWLRRDPSARYVRLYEPAESRDGQLALPQTLCPVCLDLGSSEPHRHGAEPVPRIPVALPELVDDRRRFTRDCPSCGAEDALGLLGARLASLASVAVGQIFQSAQHGDAPGESKKLITFVDSVQDASHRAGFFAARTYRFAIRTAIQTAIQSTPNLQLPLPQAGRAVVGHFAEKLGLDEALARLTPPDLREHPTYETWRASLGTKDAAPARTALRALLERRTSWEATREMGLALPAGRGLERSEVSLARLDEAAMVRVRDALVDHLREQRPVQLSGEFDARLGDAVRDFLAGWFFRLRWRGGIAHPYLDAFLASGSPYLLSKRKQPELSPFGPNSVLPRFLFEGKAHRVFDAAFSEPGKLTWLRDWARRALGVDLRDGGLDLVIRKALALATHEGLLVRVESRGGAVYGLRPEALTLAMASNVLHCRVCSHQQLTALGAHELEFDAPCPRFRCSGRLRLLSRRKRPETDYYKRLYQSGNVVRVFAKEHTGLLPRETREEVEREFKTRPTPDSANLLSATPTLEMGIDVGDLGAVMLAGVPPLPSNYQQRVGRAGRKTGNAFVLTLAHAENHDAHFFAQPRDMMSGAVDVPGCFLDAYEMVRRQLVAFAMDRHAAERPAEATIPRNLRDVLKAERAGSTEGFPRPLARFVDGEGRAILGAFLSRFPELSEGTRARLAESVDEGLSRPVELALVDAKEEVTRLDHEVKRLRDRERALDAPDAVDEDDRQEGESLEEAAARMKTELSEARRAIEAVRRELLDKHPIQVLTDAGVLPNYAFPEKGVTLRSVLRVREGEAPRQKRRYEYLRPASAALRELAPFNTFYAEGHKVTIGRIDLGTRQHPRTEDRRFCPECHHSALDDGAHPGDCPSCGAPGYRDVGQLRRVVRFEQAWSYADLLEATTADETEERREKRYRVTEVVETARATVGEAHVASTPITFGYELLRGVTLRQLNWGEVGAEGERRKIAGEHFKERGFVVCQDCGQVQPPPRGRATEVKAEHAPFCPVKLGKRAAKMVEVALARSIETEALRFVVPVELASERVATATLRASIALGARRLFGGRAAHLGFTTMSAPGRSDGRVVFLVVYDTVPGGTGYLAELHRDRARLEALVRGAFEAVSSCTCADGCYRCLYGYRDASARDDISRRVAVEMLDGILRALPKLEQVDSLSELSTANVGESALERRFARTLEASIEAAGGKVRRVPHAGRVQWSFELAGHRWRMVGQPLLGPSEGVSIPSQPDYVITPTAKVSEDGSRERLDDVRPIAVFCDGFEFHAQPSQLLRGAVASPSPTGHEAPMGPPPTSLRSPSLAARRPVGRLAEIGRAALQDASRLDDDARKRSAILESGRYRVWSVTWADLDACEGPTARRRFASLDEAVVLARTQKLVVGDALSDTTGAMALLLAYLHDPPRASSVSTAALGDAATPRPKSGFARLAEDAARRLVQGTLGDPTADLSVLLDPQVTPPARARGLARQGAAWLGLTRLQGAHTFVLRLQDAVERRRDSDYVRDWNAWLDAHVILQFVDELGATLRFVTDGSLAAELPSVAPIAEDTTSTEREGPRDAPEWAPIVEQWTEQAAFWRMLHEAGLPPPREELDLERPPSDVQLVLAEAHAVFAYDVTDRERARWAERSFVLVDLDRVKELDAARAVADELASRAERRSDA